jgi:hypothetical protein
MILLRVIHLYENDYNLLLGSQYHTANHQAEDAQTINDGNFGARTARSSLDPIGIEILQYEYSRLLRLRHLKFSNDAMACYDQIVVNLASIVSRSFGLHKNITTIQGDMLQQAVYRIKTQMGISDGYYQHCEAFPVFGTGQGSKSLPRSGILTAVFTSMPSTSKPTVSPTILLSPPYYKFT